MRYKLLGKSGLRVSELCLGTMTFGPDWGWGSSSDESAKVFHTYFEAGGNFVDTANMYTNGTSEKFVGDLIQPIREQIVLATKYSLTTRPKDTNGCGNHRKNMVQSLEASLKRLRTDYLDLFWLHAWDFMTPVDEVMRALDDLVRAGKVLYLGISDTPAWVVSQANTLADWHGWSRFVALQIEYSLIERTVERDLLPMAKTLDLAVTPWGILGGGAITGKYKKGAPRPAGNRLSEGEWGDRVLSDRNLTIAHAVSDASARVGATPSQVAIAWMLEQRKTRGVIVPILGAKNVAQLKDNLGALNLHLPPDALEHLEKASKVDLGFPHDFLRGPAIQYLFGETFPQIDNHRA